MKDIIVDITDVVERQKKSNNYNIRLAVLIVAIVVLLAVAAGIIVPSLKDTVPVFAEVAPVLPPWYVFAGIAAVAAILSVFIYNLPTSRDRKFNQPFIDAINNELSRNGFQFDDVKKKSNYTPWLSSLSKYIQGSGVRIRANMADGRKARIIKFLRLSRPILLSTERMGTKGSVLLHIVEVDVHGQLVTNVVDDEEMPQIQASQSYVQISDANSPIYTASQPTQAYPSNPLPIASQPQASITADEVRNAILSGIQQPVIVPSNSEPLVYEHAVVPVTPEPVFESSSQSNTHASPAVPVPPVIPPPPVI